MSRVSLAGNHRLRTIIPVLTVVAACASTDFEVQEWCMRGVLHGTIDGSALDDGGFGALAGLAVENDGSLYVVDAFRSQLMRFDSAGALDWIVGAIGAGPREFRNPSGVSIVDGAIAVRDVGNNRFSIWTPLGSHVKTVNLAAFDLDGVPAWAGFIDSTTVLAAFYSSVFAADASDGAAMPGWLVRAPLGSSGIDTVTALFGPRSRLLPVNGGRLPIIVPGWPYSIMAISQDHRGLIAHGSQYLVSSIDSQGRIERLLSGNDEAPPLSDSDRTRLARQLPDSSLLDRIVLPPSLPILLDISPSPDGNSILLKTGWHGNELRRWDRWTGDGRFEFSVLLPTNISTAVPRGNDIVARGEAPNGLSVVQTYRLGTTDNACMGPHPSQFK